MRSHSYNFSAKQLVYAMAPVLIVACLCILALHAANGLGLLPATPAALHPTETQLRHQAKASCSRHPARVALIGDSTCVAGIDAATLSSKIGLPAINLSLIVGIDLESYAQETADFAAANPHQLEWVILLVNPGKFSGNAESASEITLWHTINEQLYLERSGVHPFWDSTDMFAVGLIRERLAPYLLPQALSHRGAAYFGFATEVDAYMTAHNGSLIDFGEYATVSGSAHPVESHSWPIGPECETVCRHFRSLLAPGVKLAIGLTPLPFSIAPRNSHEQTVATLRQLAPWMHADLILSNLPAVLPNPCFSSSGHLNASGQTRFTEALAREFHPIHDQRE